MHWLNRILIAAFIAAVIAFGPAHMERAAHHGDLERVRRERAALQAANDTLRGKIRALAAEVAALQGDPSEIARIAREDLNLVAPGEVVFEVERPR